MSGCGDNPNNQNFNYLRAASDFSVDTVPSDTLCEANPSVFKSLEECPSTKKFLLHWKRPDDIVNFLGYRLYLDTTPADIPWKETRGQEQKAAILVNDTGSGKKGLVFFLYNGNGAPN